MCGIMVTTAAKLKDTKELSDSFQKLAHRGPDKQTQLSLDSGEFVGFHRLSIMDLSEDGQQPFQSPSTTVVCNGEIYNYLDLKKEFSQYPWTSSSDCEVLLPLYERFGPAMVSKLDGEFAFVIIDQKNEQLLAARDAMGIRPLFYGFDKEEGKICFASEMKALIDICRDIKTFPPGTFYYEGQFFSYKTYKAQSFLSKSVDEHCKNIKHLFTRAVEKRLNSDAPLGFLLSGGLDSSLVCALSAKILKKPIHTFAIGVNTDPIDLKYARQVADYIGSHHHEVTFTKEETLEHLSDLIGILESWDITTVRASMGMSLLCRYVKKNTDIKVILTGEVSDELFGYKYTDFAPDGKSFQEESEKRVRELFMYDVLRADRSISAHSLEARVPFSDSDFVDYVMSIPPEIKMNSYGIGKYLLRKSFDDGSLLPHDILMREKAAFSDAVGHSLVDWLKEYAEELYSDWDLLLAKKKYTHAPPQTKEALLYRDIFEKHYPGQSELIVDYWMPNKEWPNCKVNDPSARVLKNYGMSGK